MPSASRLTAHNRGKNLERAVSKRTNGHRYGVTGLATSDVDAGAFNYECKARKELPGWLLGAMQQAKRNASQGKVAVVILHQLNNRHDNDIVCIHFKDWIDWHGNIGLAEGDELE